jgi:chromosome segregation ATPase
LAKARKQLLGTERAPLAIVQTALARVQHERARTAELQHLLEHSTATVSSELEVLRTELAWRAGTEAALRTELSALKAEARWRAETAQHAQQVQADLQVQLGDAQRQLEQTQRQQVQTQQQLEQVHAHCAALATEHELAATHLAQAAQAVTELQAESAWRRAREHAQEEALQHSQARTAESERAVLAERHAHQRTREHLQRAKDSLASLRGEVEWRTAEMEAVRESLSRVRFAFVGRKLRHWVLQWPQAGEHA